MRNNADSTRTATNLFETAAWHCHVHVRCTMCLHHAIFAPHGLWWLFHRRHWDDSFGAVGRRMRCRMGKPRCGGRGKVSLTSQPATITLPDPDEREWKRAVSRFRC
jgi:hypothetical protein